MDLRIFLCITLSHPIINIKTAIAFIHVQTVKLACMYAFVDRETRQLAANICLLTFYRVHVRKPLVFIQSLLRVTYQLIILIGTMV